jgi:acetyl esterase/lipase
VKACLSVACALALAACGSAPKTPDPATAGSYATASLDDTFMASTGDTVPMHAVYPTNKSQGPYPIVVFGHGFQIPVSQYFNYLTHLASFGYVAVTADYPDPLTGPVNNLNDGLDLAAALDWSQANTTLKGLVDLTRAGVMGHSRGGNAAGQAAIEDSRFKAVYGVDPVYALPPGGATCDPANSCPMTYLELASLHIPSLFVGETLDSVGEALACAPASGNFQVFYAHANSPSIEVTVNGASHMSFVDDPTACGLVCEICQTPTLAQATVLNLAQAYSVAFFERNLRGRTEYDAYLTGTEAQHRYVATGEAAIQSK